jgi:AraC-like DNA-binding protein
VPVDEVGYVFGFGIPTMATQTEGERVEPTLDELEAFGSAPAADALARRETVTLTRPASVPGVELWTVTHSARKWTVHHEAYAFCVVDRYGDGPKQSWWYRRREYSASLESVLLLEPGELHVTKVLPIADFRVLMIQPWLAAKLLGPFSAARGMHFRLGQYDDAALARLFQALCGMIQDASIEASPDARGISDQRAVGIDAVGFEQGLVAFLAHVLRVVGDIACAPPRYCRRSVQLARSFILDNFQRKLSLTQLAALGAQSPWHFARSFRAEVGIPPARYLRGVRVGKALEYLRTGFRPHQVPGLVGFSDQAHMTHAFRQELGFTPAYFHRASSAPRD